MLIQHTTSWSTESQAIVQMFTEHAFLDIKSFKIIYATDHHLNVDESQDRKERDSDLQVKSACDQSSKGLSRHADILDTV